MRLIGRDKLTAFIQSCPDSSSSLNAWAQNIERNEFDHLHHLRDTFGSADYVRPYTIFNIGSNKYRLISIVDYTLKVVFVKEILKHQEYEKGRGKE